MPHRAGETHPTAHEQRGPSRPDGESSVVTIMVIDLVESTRLTGQYPDDVIARWQRLTADVEEHARTVHQGTLVRGMGDGLLMTFPTTAGAIQAAFHIHRSMPRYNVDRSISQSMYLRISLHVDKVLVDRNDIHGYGIALATRLLTVARPGDTVCTSELRDQASHGVFADFEDLGVCYLKHVAEPVRIYRLTEAKADGQWSSARRPDAMKPANPHELRLSVAVMPFETTADTPEGDIVGELVADQLIASLSRGSHLRVVSRLSSRALQGTGFSTQEIARRLRVAYVVSGRLVLKGQQLALVIEVSSADDDAVVWADRAITDAGQLLSVDDPLVPRLAGQICAAILNEQLVQVRHKPLPSLQGYSLLLGGVSLMHRFSAVDFARAKACLDALAERAPRHAEPYAWIARWHVFRAVQGWTPNPRDDRARARDMCRRALDLDPGSALALTIAGSVETALERNVERASQYFEDALAADPNEPLAWTLLGTSHSFRGEGTQAMNCSRRATDLTPLDPMRFYYDCHAAAAAVAAGEHEMGVGLAKQSLRANRLHHSTLRTLAIAQSMAGHEADARETVRQILAVQPDLTVSAFLASSPAGPYAHGQQIADALGRAGLPS